MKTPMKITVIIIMSILCSLSAFAQDAYKPSRWDKFAKKVHFTVTQESQMKNILLNERNRILQARSDTAENIIKVLGAKQRQKWDILYQRADKQGGYQGNLKKRMLLNPAYLAANFTLKPAQSKQLYYISWNHARRVNKIRKRTMAKLAKLLNKYQLKQWKNSINRRLEEEAKRRKAALMKSSK